MAWRSPTFCLMAAMVASMKWAGVQSARALQMRKRKLRRSAVPWRVWWTSGWNWTAQIRRSGLAMPATALAVLAVRWKPGGELEGFVAVGHPDGQVGGELVEERVFVVDQGDFGVAVLALVGGADLAAEVVRDELQAIADAEHGQAEREDGGVGGWRIAVIDRAGAAGEHDAEGAVGADLLERGGAGQHDGEDVLLADAAGDELCVLGAKIQDDDRLGVHETL